MNNTPAKDRNARPGRRGRVSSRPMIIAISTILLLEVTSSVAAQKHRKYTLPNFHTGQGGLVNLPEPRHRADKFPHTRTRTDADQDRIRDPATSDSVDLRAASPGWPPLI